MFSKKPSYLDIACIFATIIILIGVVIIATNPTAGVREERNSQRSKDIMRVLEAISKYNKESKVAVDTIPVSDRCEEKTNEICRSITTDCTGLVDLSELTSNKKYLVTIPTDPTAINERGTGYNVSKSKDGVVTVCAPHAEGDEKVSVSK